MVTASRPHVRRIGVVAVVSVTAVILALSSGSSGADVTAVTGSAYGYSASVSLFGGPPNVTSPTPTVTLPAGGAAFPVTASAPSGQAGAGPARFFTSGAINLSTQGTLGPNGSVTTSATINNISNAFGEVFTASSLSSSCTASESGRSGATTITSGTLQTDSGDDAGGNVHPAVVVTVPTNPSPNQTVDGHIHVNGAQDSFQFIFNEQILNPDGSITVNAAHQRFLGPTAVGDLYLGHVVCGVTAVPSSTSSSIGNTSSTGANTSSTVGNTTSTTAGNTSTTAGNTSTTAGNTSTTAGNTSTTAGNTTTTAGNTTTTAGNTTTTAGNTTTTAGNTTTTAGNTTTTAGNTTTTASNTTTTAGNTTTTAGNTTTTAGNTTTTAATTTTTAGNTTTTAGNTTTTARNTTTTLSSNPCVRDLQIRKQQVNMQIDAARQQIISSVPLDQQAMYLAQLEASRTLANSQIDQAAAACP